MPLSDHLAAILNPNDPPDYVRLIGYLEVLIGCLAPLWSASPRLRTYTHAPYIHTGPPMGLLIIQNQSIRATAGIRFSCYE
jgi:hypothetical protein